MYYMFSCTFLAALVTVNAANKSSPTSLEYELFDKLFKSYDKNIRPVIRSESALEVKLEIVLKRLNKIDEKNQRITWNVWAGQVWYDYRLRWNVSEFGIKQLTVHPHQLWLPDIYLYNNAQELYRGFDHGKEDNIFVYYNGTVNWFTNVILKSTCSFDAKMFPFDDQHCSLHFGSWAFSGNQLNLTSSEKFSSVNKNVVHGEWKVLGLTALKISKYYECCPEPYPSIIFTLSIKRRSWYFVYSFIIPSTVIVFISVLAFSLPVSSNARISFLITNLLSLTLYSSLISDMIPLNANGTPLISKYLTAVLMEITISIVATCIIINIAMKSSSMPSLIGTLMNNRLSRALRIGMKESGNSAINTKEETQAVANLVDLVDHEDSNAKQTDFTSTEAQSRHPQKHPEPELAIRASSFPVTDRYSNEFKERMMLVVAEMSIEAEDEVRLSVFQNERRLMAQNMDTILHLIFLLILFLTIIIFLATPPTVIF